MTASGLLDLRDYQAECLDAGDADRAQGLTRLANVLPTGAGKTVVFSHRVKRFRGEHPAKRVLILAHTDELVTQAARKLKIVAPHLRVGIVKAKRDDVHAEVIVASVQSLRRAERRARIRDVGLIIVDECHHVMAKTYLDVLEHYGAMDDVPRCYVEGYTATLMRGDRKALGNVWQKVSFKRDILFMIRRGYLLDPYGIAVEVPDLDLSKVKKSRGDFQDGALGEAMTDALAPELVAKAYVEHASDRAGLMFWPTVAAAHEGAEAMNAAGVRTEVISGTTRDDDRRDILERAEAGLTQVISNCMVLTEGFDWPRASCVVIARPTRSAALYQQMVGRALRLYGDQTRALVLDVVGASRTNDLRSLVDLSQKPIRIKDGETLAEAEDAFDEAEAEDLAVIDEFVAEVEHYTGPTVDREFDLLARKGTRRWLTTHGGARFLKNGDEHYVFVLPTTNGAAFAGTWDVSWCTKTNAGEGRQGGFDFTLDGHTGELRGVELSYAMTWAERIVDDAVDRLETEVVGQKVGGRWRKRAASRATIGKAYAVGVSFAGVEMESLTAGEVSDLIDIAEASRRIDPIVKVILERVNA